MNAGAFGNRVMLFGRPRDLADRGNGDTVILIAQPKNDELLVCHGVRFRLQFRLRRPPAHQGYAEQVPTGTAGPATAARPTAVHRRAGRSRMISASPSPRVSKAGAGSTMSGSRRRISRVASTTTPTAPSPIDITTTLPRCLDALTGRQPQQCAQRHKRQQPVPQRHHAQHRGFRARQLGDMVRQRNDLPHTVERQRIFLLAETEAQQRDQASRAGAPAEVLDRERRPACVGVEEIPSRTKCPLSRRDGLNSFDRALAFARP